MPQVGIRELLGARHEAHAAVQQGKELGPDIGQERPGCVDHHRGAPEIVFLASHRDPPRLVAAQGPEILADFGRVDIDRRDHTESRPQPGRTGHFHADGTQAVQGDRNRRRSLATGRDRNLAGEGKNVLGHHARISYIE